MENAFNDIRNPSQFRQHKTSYAHVSSPMPPLEMIKALENATTNYSTKSNVQTNFSQHNSEVN